MSGQGKAPQAPGHPWASRWHPALSPGCRGATGTPRAPRVSAPPAKQRRLSAGLGASGASRSLRSELFYFFLFIKHQDKPRGERSSEPPSRRRFAVTPCREAPMPCPATTGSARLAPCPCPSHLRGSRARWGSSAAAGRSAPRRSSSCRSRRCPGGAAPLPARPAGGSPPAGPPCAAAPRPLPAAVAGGRGPRLPAWRPRPTASRGCQGSARSAPPPGGAAAAQGRAAGDGARPWPCQEPSRVGGSPWPRPAPVRSERHWAAGRPNAAGPLRLLRAQLLSLPSGGPQRCSSCPRSCKPPQKCFCFCVTTDIAIIWL